MAKRSICVPSNLNLSELLKTNKPQFDIDFDYALYIIGLIYEIPTYRKDLVDDSGWVPINAQRLQKTVRNYRLYLDYLVKTGVFEEDKQYEVGSHSRHFKFGEKYREQKGQLVTLEKRTLLKNLLLNVDRDYEAEKRYKNLLQWFNDDLEFDFNAAMKYIEWQLEMDLKNDVRSKATGEPIAYPLYNLKLLQAARLHDHTFSFKLDTETSWRLYTNLTGCKKNLRNFLKYDGQNLVSIDIKNSQPVLSTVLLKDDFYSKESDKLRLTLYQVSPSLYEQFYKFFAEYIYTFPDVNRKSKEVNLQQYLNIILNDPDYDNERLAIQGYISEAEKGTFYEYISAQLKAKQGIFLDPQKDRKELKALVLQSLYSSNKFFNQEKAGPKRLFAAIFPDVYEIFACLKEQEKSDLAVLLQTIEAKVMLDHVAKRISKEKRTIPIYTIHDAIITTIGNEGYIRAVIEEEMWRLLKVKVTTGVEHLSPEYAYM